MSATLFSRFCALLMLVGVATFLWGGAQHPATGPSLGTVGSPEYFREFARHIAAHEGWQAIHAGILAGPLLWALGATGLVRRLRSATDPGWAPLGLFALGLGAALWSVVFVFDGFVAPLQATSVLAGAESASAILAFRTNQEAVIRLGLVAWLLIGGGVLSLAVAVILSGTVGRAARLALGPAGLLVGGWSIVAWIAGPFRPGPFVSPFWTLTAVATAAWFLAAGVALLPAYRMTSAPAVDVGVRGSG